MISFRQTIGFRLILVSFFLLTFPLLIDAFVVFSRRYETRVEAAKRYLTESAVIRVLPTGSYEPFPSEAFDVLAYSLGIEQQFPQKPDRELNQKLIDVARINQLNDLTIITIDKSGRYIITASAKEELLGEDVTDFFTDPNPFQVADKFADPVAAYLRYRDNTLLYMVLAKGYRFQNGERMGVIAATVDASEWIHQLLTEDTTYYPVRFVLLDRLGVIIESTERALLFHYFHALTPADFTYFRKRHPQSVADSLPQEPLEVTTPVNKKSFIRFMWNDQEQFAVKEPLPWWDYSLLAYSSKEKIYAQPLRDFFGIFSSYSIILIVGSIIIYLISKRWVKPVQALGSVMMQVQKGDFKARYQKDRFGLQINTLGSIFNEMVEKLLENRERAETERIQRDLYEQELKMGEEAQRTLLKEPDQSFGEVDVAQCYFPAYQVGGDFYDIFRKPNGKLLLMIADASGKGVMACCFSLAARNILHTLSLSHDDLGYVLSSGNNLFCDDTGDSGMFVTVQMAQYDYESRLLSYCSLGHNPAIVCRKDGSVEQLGNREMAMGVLVKKEPIQAAQIGLEVGDVVVLYTDGVTEMHNPASELFGEERLIKEIQKRRNLSAQAILQAIEKEVYAFANGRAQFDDVTLIVVKING